MVPHLITALNGPLLELEQKILDATPAIERWFRLEWQEHTPPFYCSVDLRNAGFKLAPVDTNLFPGGFNNLAPEMLPLAVQAAMAAIEKICPDAKNLLLIPERHTRNMFYLQNVARQVDRKLQLGLADLGAVRPAERRILEGFEGPAGALGAGAGRKIGVRRPGAGRRIRHLEPSFQMGASRWGEVSRGRRYAQAQRKASATK